MTSRVRDVVHAAEQAKQRAVFYSEARSLLARRYLADAATFESLSTVLEELLIAACAAEQEAQRLLSQPVGIEASNAAAALLRNGDAHALARGRKPRSRGTARVAPNKQSEPCAVGQKPGGHEQS
jgi:hypothetical protein